MNKVGIIGGSGFAGEELIRFLLGHDSTSVIAISSRDRKGHPVSEIVQGADLVFVDPDDKVFFDCDLACSMLFIVFLELPEIDSFNFFFSIFHLSIFINFVTSGHN